MRHARAITFQLAEVAVTGPMIRAAERWRAIKVTGFERRQMTAVRQELDQKYQATIGTPETPSARSTPADFSSSSRT